MFRPTYKNYYPYLMNSQFRQYIIDCNNKSISNKIDEYNKKQILTKNNQLLLQKTSEIILYDNTFYQFASFLSITTFIYFLYYRKH